MDSVTLYPFQEEGVAQLLQRRCVLFGDEMGLGKTVQAAVAIKRLFQQGAIHRVLVVCPSSLCRNWRKELRTWVPEIPAVIYEGGDRHGMLFGNAKILIGSFETVAMDLSCPTCEGKSYCDLGIDVLILDEAHRIKDAKSSKALIFCAVLAARRWALTGTPLENHPSELSSILRFLNPNEFMEEDALQDENLLLKYRDLCLFRRTKQQVGLQLPPKRITTVNIALSPSQAAEYENTLSTLRENLSAVTDLKAMAGILLSGLQALRRIAVIASDGESSKLDLLDEEVAELTERNEKVVVFSTFANLVLPAVQQRLSKYGAVSYTGSMSVEERELSHKQFLEDQNVRVMCASLRAAGVGLTWVVAVNVYHLDLWWNPQAMRQAEDRVHRIGQTQNVLIRRLISEDTIEEGIATLQQVKQDIFDLIINESPTGTEAPTDMNDLLSLIGLKLGPSGHSVQRGNP